MKNKIVITQYWNKIIDDPTAHFGTRVLPEYEIKSQWKIDGTLEDLKKRWGKNSRMTIEPDRITEDLGKYFGIHLYQVITRG